MDRLKKCYRPGFDTLEDRFMPSATLTLSVQGESGKPWSASPVSSTTSLGGLERGRENGIIAILIG